MKSKRIFILIFILSVAIIFYLYNGKYDKTIKISLGDEIPSQIVIDSKEYNILWKTLKDTKTADKLGTYKGYFKYHFKNNLVLLIVEDTEAPIIDGVKDITIFVNEEPDFYKNINITDNSNDKISKTIEGFYDNKKEGVYKLEYVVSDKSGNTNSYKFNLYVKVKDDPKLGKLVETTKNGFNIYYRNECYYIDDIIIANKTYPLSSNFAPGENKEAKENLLTLIDDAKKENISLYIDNGYRSYQTQKYLYQRWVNTLGFDEAERVSARPGYSEHQTGLSFDIVDNSKKLDAEMNKKPSGKWINDNCYKYGFIIRYVEGKESITGYSYEPWHIRYVGTSLAKKLYNNGDWITLEEYFGITSIYKKED